MALALRHQGVALELRHVEIIFHDPWSSNDVGWKDVSYVQSMTPAVCHVAGYIVLESETQIIIASMVIPETGDVSLLSCVPKGCIVKVNDLL